MDRLALFSPDQAFVSSIPVELKVVLFLQGFGDREGDSEPMRRPTGAERLADTCGLELVGNGVFKRWAGQVWRRVDLEADPLVARRSAFVELATSIS
jgi:hypothetical protein